MLHNARPVLRARYGQASAAGPCRMGKAHIVDWLAFTRILIVQFYYKLVLREESTALFPVKPECAGRCAGVCANQFAGTGGPCGWGARGVLRADGRLGEASLPGGPALDPAHRQQAVGRDTLVGHDAEELAGGQAGIFHEQLEIVSRGKIRAQLPGANGGNGNAQVLGNLFERNLALPPPVGEGGRKAGADVAVKLSLSGHGESLR